MLEFETSAGNMYAWDDKIGLFIPSSPTMQAVMARISSQKSLSRENAIEQLKENFNQDEIEFCYDWINKWMRIVPPNEKCHTAQKISTEDIKKYILKRGLSQLTLGVTEDCNFRCKYCAYSDFYEYNRGYSNKYMEFAIAKKAIDYFFSLLIDGKRYNPIRKISIGFYGGEPLLNFSLIRKCVEYIEAKYTDFKILYGMTTNGSLLDVEKANWLMKHNFIISVSLDGPEDEHDKLRVYRNGTGTFRDVMEGIHLIMESGYEYIYVLPVFDWKSDLFKRETFFKTVDVPEVLKVALVNNSGGSKYFDQFTKDDYFAYLDQLERARLYYFDDVKIQTRDKKTSFFDKLIGRGPGDEIFRGVSVHPPPQIMPVTNSCVPGRKLFVDVNGGYHICEKLDDKLLIGNVDEGLNFETIRDLLNNYFVHMDKCLDCNVTRKCGHCFQMFANKNGFSYSSHICEKVESIKKRSFAKSLAIAEINPDFIDMSNYRYKNTRKFYEG